MSTKDEYSNMEENLADMLSRLKDARFESSLPGFNYREELHEASQYLFGKAEKRKQGKHTGR